jgi:hypothetical protein
MKTSASLTLLTILLFLANSRLVVHHDSMSFDSHSQLVNVNELANITNLEANNWVLGNITQN